MNQLFFGVLVAVEERQEPRLRLTMECVPIELGKVVPSSMPCQRNESYCKNVIRMSLNRLKVSG